MKKLILRLIVAALAVATVLALAGCDQWKTPYEKIGKDGYNVVVRFDAGDGKFSNRNDVYVVDTFRMTDFEKNQDGKHEIPLITPDSSFRPMPYSASRDGYFLAGWYTERELRFDENGNMLDDFGNITTDPAKQGYIYSGLWDFENDTLKVDPASAPTTDTAYATLYAAWIPNFVFEFYVQGESEPYDTASTINLQLPTWKNGKQSLGSLPGIDGKSFTGAYLDPECTEVITDTITGEVDYAHGITASPVTKVYTTWRDGEWFRIEKLDQLTRYASETGCYELTCDLDFEGKTWPRVFTNNGFSGTIEGGGHKISNVTVIQSDNSILQGGIFKVIGDNAVIRDLTFDNVTYSITAGSRKTGASFGAFASAVSENATLDNVTFNGTLEIVKSRTLALSESSNHTVGIITGNGALEGLSGTVVCILTDGDVKTPITPDDSGIIDISLLGLDQ
ncbi:MAG: hypothetical protein IJY69_03550 [Clostridia bacterium]|nr:hypothetical protein [Clostridia bacterium]